MVPVVVRPPVGDTPPTARLYYGLDVLEGLLHLKDESVHSVVTSPPYWGLRSYLGDENSQKEQEMGTEESPEAYVQRLVKVFAAVRRVLRPEGTLWLNLGDSYGPTKNLEGLPWRVALALQRDGWYLRSAFPWVKRNCMPDRSLDRPTVCHEYWFLLSKQPQYFYDRYAVNNGRHRRTSDWYTESLDGVIAEQEAYLEHLRAVREEGLLTDEAGDPVGVRSSVLPYRGAHFAVFPPEMIRPLVAAGTSEFGCCVECGAPYARQVDAYRTVDGERVEDLGMFKSSSKSSPDQSQGVGHWRIASEFETLGWEPSCECGGDTTRCTVLDPFSGTATTGFVSLELGRHFIGIDLNAEYLDTARARILGERPPEEPVPNEPGDVLDLFGGGT